MSLSSAKAKRAKTSLSDRSIAGSIFRDNDYESSESSSGWLEKFGQIVKSAQEMASSYALGKGGDDRHQQITTAGGGGGDVRLEGDWSGVTSAARKAREESNQPIRALSSLLSRWQNGGSFVDAWVAEIPKSEIECEIDFLDNLHLSDQSRMDSEVMKTYSEDTDHLEQELWSYKEEHKNWEGELPALRAPHSNGDADKPLNVVTGKGFTEVKRSSDGQASGCTGEVESEWMEELDDTELQKKSNSKVMNSPPLLGK
uniref:Uncharacterized protein n=1 Tax=Trichuris muris TaxID=70415 RepID=A0A5S6QD52_TRIMR